MTPKKTVTTTPSHNNSTQNNKLFGKENYIWIIVGTVVIAFGLLLMAGGKSSDPNVFNENEVYSTRRLTIAPLLILLGFGIEVFAIFRKPRHHNN